MSYFFRKMNQKEAEEIAYNWNYKGVYSFYDLEADEEDLVEFLDEKKRGNRTYSVFEGESLVGFFSWTYKNEAANISLGLRPDHTGQGEGLRFLESCLEFLDSPAVTLDVALFNGRAIRVYEKAGFREVYRFNQETNGDSYIFVHMEKTAEKSIRRSYPLGSNDRLGDGSTFPTD
ncbi:GNAT family N-acetyltransferase [Salimicrobium flavidum]|uniref:Ribosomal-protein-alanine N-acetyltransferase n=1 Tax=Salimicrobium flavidum TaxID=570947 RepID=A0A1N7J871_9BACI|nr:GNAT family N-acetyltransferase [Salimicrobium flavidum]SIS45522.1 ribosomal-protein-alanine N-acetyltransferase [Salimicrobium flavidum]